MQFQKQLKHLEISKELSTQELMLLYTYLNESMGMGTKYIERTLGQTVLKRKFHRERSLADDKTIEYG